MYAAKRAAGDGYAFYEPHMHLAASRRHELKADLQRAVVRGELVVHYQPIVNLPDGSLAGVEALVRWQHPERGLVPPDEFIPLAEETGLIRAIDDWVLRSACRQLAGWRAAHPRLARATGEREHERATTWPTHGSSTRVASALTDAGLPPQNLVLEVTESALAADVDSAVERLSALKSLGVRLALDDFGTGYSSLAYLQTFPLDVIKVDRTFVARLDQVGDPGLAGLVVDIGHGLGLVGHRRGRRDHRAVRASCRDGLRPCPGLPVLQAAPGRPGHRAPPAGDSVAARACSARRGGRPSPSGGAFAPVCHRSNRRNAPRKGRLGWLA